MLAVNLVLLDPEHEYITYNNMFNQLQLSIYSSSHAAGLSVLYFVACSHE